MHVSPRGATNGGVGWWFQYGVWDLRVNCPCGQREPWLFGVKWCAHRGGRSWQYQTNRPCPGCGYRGMLEMELGTKCELDAEEVRRKAWLEKIHGGW